jgi:hypothetical protein
MPTLRRLLLLVFLSVAVLAAVSVIRRTLACPIEPPPQPLRTLYKLSARVVVARVLKSEIVESDENSMVMKTSLEVTDNLKGDNDSTVQVYHWVWLGEGPTSDNFVPGNRLLLFLDKRKEGGYEINDEDYGLKKLSDDDLKVYVERLEELSEIMKKDPPDNAAIVEWLVRCAEERATRWEGAYELKLSAEATEREREEKEAAEKGGADAATAKESGDDASAQEGKESAGAPAEATGEAQASGASGGATPEVAEATADGETTEVEVDVFSEFRYTEPDSSLVAQLNDGQKRRLADALFEAEQIEKGEDALLSVVKDFKDSRFAGFVIAQLRRVEKDPPMEAERWLEVLADSLKNESFTNLVDAYTKGATYYEEEENTANSSDANRSEAEEEAIYKAAVERATRKRVSMLKDLLSQFDRLVASGEVALN